MKQTIGFGQFCDAFSDTYKNNFSYAGKRALFDYLEEYEADAGTEVELDTVALCCEYSEYENALEAAAQYAGCPLADKEQTPEEQETAALEWLQDRTQVIPFSNQTGDTIKAGIIIANF